jgi:hypothetical protein
MKRSFADRGMTRLELGHEVKSSLGPEQRGAEMLRRLAKEAVENHSEDAAECDGESPAKASGGAKTKHPMNVDEGRNDEPDANDNEAPSDDMADGCCHSDAREREFRRKRRLSKGN